MENDPFKKPADPDMEREALRHDPDSGSILTPDEERDARERSLDNEGWREQK